MGVGVWTSPSASIVQMWTRRSGSRKGRPRKNVESTKPKIAAFAPMPRARVRTAAPVKPGDLRSTRRPKRTSWSRVSRKCTPRAARVFRGHALREELLGLPLEVILKLFVEFPLDAMAAEERAEPQWNRVHPMFKAHRILPVRTLCRYRRQGGAPGSRAVTP